MGLGLGLGLGLFAYVSYKQNIFSPKFVYRTSEVYYASPLMLPVVLCGNRHPAPCEISSDISVLLRKLLSGTFSNFLQTIPNFYKPATATSNKVYVFFWNKSSMGSFLLHCIR